jgi:CheY-like chemotaxis protein
VNSINSPWVKKTLNVLIIENDPEMQSLYHHFFNIILSHVSFTIVDGISKVGLKNNNYNIKERKNRLNNSNDKNYYNYNLNLAHQSVFDVIIFNITVEYFRDIEIAKEIIENNPRQKIIFTTAYNLGEIRKKMENDGILSSITILQKPFRFSNLLSILYPTRTMFDRIRLTDHVLMTYNTIHEELTDAVDFIKRGLATTELNLLLIRGDMDVKDTVTLLESAGLANANVFLKDNSIIILKNEEWYMPDGKVDKYRIINQWHNLVKQSIQNGKRGLRAFCMMDCFFENGFSTELVDYECTLPSQFQIPFTPICAYRQSDLDSLPEQEKKKLIECHNHSLIC